MCEIPGIPSRLAIYSLKDLSEETVRFRFNRARQLVETAQEHGWDRRILEQALSVLQDKRP